MINGVPVCNWQAPNQRGRYSIGPDRATGRGVPIRAHAFFRGLRLENGQKRAMGGEPGRQNRVVVQRLGQRGYHRAKFLERREGRLQDPPPL